MSITKLDDYLPLRDFIPCAASVLGCEGKSKEEMLEEFLSIPLSLNTIRAIAGDILLDKIGMKIGLVDKKGDEEADGEIDAVCSSPSEEVETNPKKVTSTQILKKLGLPFQIGVIKSMVPSAKPPGKISEKTKSKEIEEIKAFVLQALEKLTPSIDKRVYVLRHIVEGDEAGQIYLDTFSHPFKIFDTKPSLVKSRAGKLVEVCRLILGEIPPHQPVATDG